MNINVYRIGTCPPGATRYGNRGVEVQAMDIRGALKIANARYKKHCDATGRCVFAVFSRREAKQ